MCTKLFVTVYFLQIVYTNFLGVGAPVWKDKKKRFLDYFITHTLILKQMNNYYVFNTNDVLLCSVWF